MSSSISEEEIQRLRAALASALTSENEALKEVAQLRTPCAHMPTCGCFAHGHREGRRAGVAEERARWEARLRYLREIKDARFASDMCKEDAQLTVGMVRSIAIMSGEGEVTP